MSLTGDIKRATVPKFSSQSETSTLDSTSLRSPRLSRQMTDDEERNRKRHRSHRDSHRSSNSHSSRHRHHRRERSPNTEHALVKYEKSKAKEPTYQDENLFVVDKRGDPLILRYGSNDRSRVPDYRRYGSGRVLGTQKHVTISREGAREEFSIGGYRYEGSVFRENHVLLLKAAQKKSRRIRQELSLQNGQDSTAGGDFMALAAPSKSKGGDSEYSDISDQEQPGYRSIGEKQRGHELSDSDLEYESDSSAVFGDNPLLEVSDFKKRSIELSRQVKQHPADIDSWLELVSLQDDLLGNEYEGREWTRDELKSVADIKLSMIESALPHAKADADRERLLLRLMREGSKIWNPKQLAKRWQDVSQENINSFDLWKAHLDFEMSNMSAFTVDDLKSFHIERLHFLKAQLSTSASEPGQILLCHQLIYVFLRMTRFLFDAGFRELAVAAWQAQLELMFARPHNLTDAAPQTVLAILKDFWESEVPRIGEENARGWRWFHENVEMADLPEAKQEQVFELPKTRDIYKAWASKEREQEVKSTMPARTLDEGSDEDPFRVVMFTDVEELLFCLPIQALPGIEEQLIDSFLLFYRLPPVFGRCNWIQSARNDPFVAGACDILDKAPSDPLSSPEETSRKQAQFPQTATQIAISEDTLFSRTSNWFRYLPSNPSESGAGMILTSLVSNTVKQLARSFGVEALAEYSLAMDWMNEPTSVKKAAKALLKVYPSNMSLYNAYALAESMNGNNDVAQKVLKSATSQQPRSPGKSALLLWHTWAWMELEAGHKERALARICVFVEEQSTGSSAEETEVSPSQLLKARQKLSTQRDYHLSSGNLATSAQFAQSFTLLEYLTAQGRTESISDKQGNITAAVSSVISFSEEVSSRGHGQSIAHERFLQFAARLLYFHASRGPYRPIHLREQFLKYIKLFPRNAMFLHLFAWAESSLRIDDPVRDVLRATVLVEPHDCVSSRIFAIRHEQHIGNFYSTRAAFERAIDSDVCKGNTDLWKGYIRFCYEKKELRSKAKDVFYRGVHACLWSKELIMEAFTTLIREMDSGELRSVYNTMQTKGLRVHVDLERFLNERRDSSES